MWHDRSAPGTAALAGLLLLALPVVSGCLGSAQAAAGDHRAEATELARQWDPEASLVGVVGLEGQGWPAHLLPDSARSDGEASHWDGAEADRSVGDGRAVVWAYRFVSQADPSQLHVIVLNDEGDLLKAYDRPWARELRPLEDWSVSSEEAAEIARETNDGVQRALDSQDHAMILSLAHPRDRQAAVWFVAGGGGDDQGAGGGLVILDAATGEVLENHGASFQ